MAVTEQVTAKSDYLSQRKNYAQRTAARGKTEEKIDCTAACGGSDSFAQGERVFVEALDNCQI